VKIDKVGEGLNFTMGGVAAVVYRDADKATGNYHTVAKFTQTKSPRAGHGEGFGWSLRLGPRRPKPGVHLFPRRQDGMFIIKRRAGTVVSTVQDWTENAAVNKADATGKSTNEVAVQVQNGKASFTVNGKEVYATDAAKIDASGIVGLRVNHMLDVHVKASRFTSCRSREAEKTGDRPGPVPAFWSTHFTPSAAPTDEGAPRGVHAPPYPSSPPASCRAGAARRSRAGTRTRRRPGGLTASRTTPETSLVHNCDMGRSSAAISIGTRISSIRRSARLSRSISSRNRTTVGRINSEAIRKPRYGSG